MTDTHTDIGQALDRRVAGQPVGVWLIAAGAVAVTYSMWRKHAAAAAVSTDSGSVGYTTDTASGVGNLASGGAATSGDPGTVNPITPAIQTNQDWQNAVERVLLGQGFQPLLVDTALSDYLNGQPLNTSEQAVIAAALLAGGNPPIAPPPALPGLGGAGTGDTGSPAPSTPGAGAAQATTPAAPSNALHDALSPARAMFDDTFHVPDAAYASSTASINPGNQLVAAIDAKAAGGSITYINRYGVVVTTEDTPANRASIQADGGRIL